MEEQAVTLQIAILAKEKGFRMSIDENYCCPSVGNEYILDAHYVPTQSLLQKWLREEHNLHVIVWFNNLTEKWRVDDILMLPDMRSILAIDVPDKEFVTYELALEHGLYESLKSI
jgi:hypothetical protein